MPNDISKPNELKVTDTRKAVQQLKSLPFYDKLAVLLEAKHLIPDTSASTQKALIELSLKLDHIQTIEKYCRNDSNGTNYDVQVILRFFLFDTPANAQSDNFPLNIKIFVNGHKLSNTLTCQPQPINITKYLKMNPEASNKIIVNWSQEPSKEFLVTAFLMHKRTSAELFERVKNIGVKPYNYTSTLIKEKLKNDEDNEIATTMLRASLICPLVKTRMNTPFR